MQRSIRLVPLFCLLTASLLWPLRSAHAQFEVTYSQPTYLDRQYMSQQRTGINELAANNTGQRFSGMASRDIALMQRLRDQGIVTPTMTRELPALGIVLGDLLAKELQMDWVIFEDEVGRSRALRFGDSESLLFPVTMLARRKEGGGRTDVQEIYDSAVAMALAEREPLPFQ